MAPETNQNSAGFFKGWWKLMMALPGEFTAKVVDVTLKLKELGEEDPRRVIHSLKVVFAITLVSTFYYFDDDFGSSAMWAVFTVIVVPEFSVGATLGKALNRGLATLLAGTLGIGSCYLANSTGNVVQPIILGTIVFLLAAGVTYIRFFPQMKARYDYGLLVFILTFCFISVSSYREDKILDIAQKRVTTILIGGLIPLLVCIFVYPIWAGDDLHNLISKNIEKLGNSLEGFGDEYFRTSEDRESNKLFLQEYRSVLNSKQAEENLTPSEIKNKLQEPCIKMSKETGKALKELAVAISKMVPPSDADPHMTKSKVATMKLLTMLRSGFWEGTNLYEAIPGVTVASLLLDVVSCTDRLLEVIQLSKI